MTTADPSRSPVGTESMWAYTHLPQRVHQDEGPDGLTGSWDYDEINRMADRIQARISRYAPDFESRIITRRILGPHQLQERDAKLINGALNGGSVRPTPASGLPTCARPRSCQHTLPRRVPWISFGPPWRWRTRGLRSQRGSSRPSSGSDWQAVVRLGRVRSLADGFVPPLRQEERGVRSAAHWAMVWGGAITSEF